MLGSVGLAEVYECTSEKQTNATWAKELRILIPTIGGASVTRSQQNVTSTWYKSFRPRHLPWKRVVHGFLTPDAQQTSLCMIPSTVDLVDEIKRRLQSCCTFQKNSVFSHQFLVPCHRDCRISMKTKCHQWEMVNSL